MAEFPTYEEIAKNVAKKALDDILYQGKSIREWVKIIMEQEPRKITLEDVKEYCKPRCLTIIDNELLYELTHPKIKTLEQEPKSPCDLCRYNPPSSADGKPCTMCPAEGSE